MMRDVETIVGSVHDVGVVLNAVALELCDYASDHFNYGLESTEPIAVVASIVSNLCLVEFSELLDPGSSSWQSRVSVFNAESEKGW